ncbi:1,6-anhydro-N-acetylmuramyl-L-alanine amidase AmpD [Amphritea balenae]|uniref:1,6-anhydro-N-acetylmuramyl-L-alanine amidase AmpD n=1 Tax=Amphritea balenae TaxID=452629 RepID=A0A3P1SVD7_9GAMM|nr:1,6-anhydro-N-acetylmuramyl-L-alanine amidase AmpD [Amphritea balenae]RRD00113.1 1,6-anhydro-N-acetylmuramyl-L-alanine amidase AmpD [Amphritea balenae]GGK76743.1 N-acetyl-anhydromuranmyl-L-alanine amidase [Amphritea balenae]
MQIVNGWLVQAIRCPSPNYNLRPEGVYPRLLVVHNISLPPGKFGGEYIERFFQNRLNASEHPYFETIAELQVSAHLLIKRTGELIQFVSFDERAWHAGQSEYCGSENCNDFSIGIELEGTDSCAYTQIQYSQLAELTRALISAYPSMNADDITGHSDIAPGRKTDPGASFNWRYFLRLVKQES